MQFLTYLRESLLCYVWEESNKDKKSSGNSWGSCMAPSVIPEGLKVSTVLPSGAVPQVPDRTLQLHVGSKTNKVTTA